MRNSAPNLKHSHRAFTIVEILVVIAIIGILAALLLPVLVGAQRARQKKQAALEIGQIVTAIQQYDSVYGRFPVSAAAQSAAGTNDFTYGALFNTPNPSPDNVFMVETPAYPTNNSELIAILMDITNTAVTSVNMNHQKNPQQTVFLTPKMSGWDPSQPGPPVPGVGNDLVYRDPWGNPYVITMDLSYDEQCQDAFYSLTAVSSPNPPNNPTSGINGLINPDGMANNYRYHGKVMVWSAGPDGKIDPNAAANTGVNKDNVLSWAP